MSIFIFAIFLLTDNAVARPSAVSGKISAEFLMTQTPPAPQQPTDFADITTAESVSTKWDTWLSNGDDTKLNDLYSQWQNSSGACPAARGASRDPEAFSNFKDTLALINEINTNPDIEWWAGLNDRADLPAGKQNNWHKSHDVFGYSLKHAFLCKNKRLKSVRFIYHKAPRGKSTR